ncbi:CHASE domain-containing protein [Shewanella sp. FJAT-52076]|uniref:sensor histidine kinase n=1 Tax=Shewanella sp. FJAT-52076 TaxID=2864202 RepID=UPI0021AC9DC0|nr:CHASE domain-containing protein [Shewanella sp. FJAT-52076]
MNSQAPTKDPNRFRLPPFVWGVMLASMAFAFTGWYQFHQYINDLKEERFEDMAQELKLAIETRMLAYEQVLRSGVGLFKASDGVSREEWRTYVANAKLDKYYPGIQGVGFSQVVRKPQLQQFEAAVRAEGFPAFRVYPDGDRPVYHSILYLEPFDWRNQRAFGYDMYSEPRRRRAIDWASDTGNAAISGKITLVQETGEDMQAGFLMYLPLYAKDDKPGPESLLGTVYAPFRMDNLIRGILGNRFNKLQLEIFDGEEANEENLMFRSPEKGDSWRIQTELPIEIGGQKWLLHAGSNEDFLSQSEAFQSQLMLLMAVIFQLLMFYFLLSIAKARHHESLLSREIMNNESRFRLVVEASPSALIITNRRGVITLVNKHTEQLFGYTREELLGKSVNVLLPEALAKVHQGHMESYLANPIAKKMSLRDELYGRTKSGGLVPVEVGLTPIHFASGISVLATINDISVRRNIEAQRMAHTLELERINKELDSFAYIASHDLKSPLRGIEQLAQWIEEDLKGKLDPSTGKYLQLIQSRTQRMSQLLDGLLLYSRIGRADESFSPVEVKPLIKDTFALVAPPIGFSLKLSGDFPTINTAKVPLELVIRNLFSNAIKHHDKGAGEISVSVDSSGDMLKFCVADDGPGIPAEYQEKVFNIFQTLKARDEVEGCGLGLSLVRKTVERYGGKVWLISQGRGCQFWFSWPKQLGAQTV